MKTIRLSAFLFFLLLIGCTCAQARSESEMNELASALTKASSAVESTVHYKKQGLDKQDMELLALATRHDPGLLEPFKGYVLRAKVEDGHSIILVCTADGSSLLLEDATCTSAFEKHHWQRSSLPRCDYTLAVKDVCP
jgi:hypothetical protein